MIDEAHNLIPRETTTAYGVVLREQIRTIAAEARKYGLFLIPCSQRPDKLDPRVVSECANVAVLRMVSEQVLKTACDLLGIKFDNAKPCLVAPSENGFGILFGEWAGEDAARGIPFKGAAQRTQGAVELDPGWLT